MNQYVPSAEFRRLNGPFADFNSWDKPRPEPKPAPPISLSDPDNAPFIAEYEEAREQFLDEGCTLATYVQTRRIDEGLTALEELMGTNSPPQLVE